MGRTQLKRFINLYTKVRVMYSSFWKEWSTPDKLTLLGTAIGVLGLVLYLMDKHASSTADKRVFHYYAKSLDGNNCWVLPLMTLWNDGIFEIDMWVEWIESDPRKVDHTIERIRGTWEHVMDRYLFKFPVDERPYMKEVDAGPIRYNRDNEGRISGFQMNDDVTEFFMWECQLSKFDKLTHTHKIMYSYPGQMDKLK